MTTDILIESCMEGGTYEDAEINAKLAGKGGTPEMKAVISLIELWVGNERLACEVPGCKTRDEHAGAARSLRELRARLINGLFSNPEAAK